MLISLFLTFLGFSSSTASPITAALVTTSLTALPAIHSSIMPVVGLVVGIGGLTYTCCRQDNNTELPIQSNEAMPLQDVPQDVRSDSTALVESQARTNAIILPPNLIQHILAFVPKAKTIILPPKLIHHSLTFVPKAKTIILPSNLIQYIFTFIPTKKAKVVIGQYIAIFEGRQYTVTMPKQPTEQVVSLETSGINRQTIHKQFNRFYLLNSILGNAFQRLLGVNVVTTREIIYHRRLMLRNDYEQLDVIFRNIAEMSHMTLDLPFQAFVITKLTPTGHVTEGMFLSAKVIKEIFYDSLIGGVGRMPLQRGLVVRKFKQVVYIHYDAAISLDQLLKDIVCSNSRNASWFSRLVSTSTQNKEFSEQMNNLRRLLHRSTIIGPAYFGPQLNVRTDAKFYLTPFKAFAPADELDHDAAIQLNSKDWRYLVHLQHRVRRNNSADPASFPFFWY